MYLFATVFTLASSVVSLSFKVSRKPRPVISNISSLFSSLLPLTPFPLPAERRKQLYQIDINRKN